MFRYTSRYALSSQLIIRLCPAVADAYKEYDVLISKQDEAGKNLEDAKIEIYKDKEKLEEWKSDKTDHPLTLTFGTYTFHEVSAPAGYLTVDDFEFTIEKDGTITTDAKTEDNKIIVVDKKEKTITKERDHHTHGI